VSGPVSEAESGPAEDAVSDRLGAVEIFPSRTAQVGSGTVRRALPLRRHRTVGPWCFLDHFGPEAVTPDTAMKVGPHPHIGLQTVTWLLEGEAVHTDSLGTEQPIRPGQLNLMSAGRGVAHAEDGRDRPVSTLHGVQLWVAQPDATRAGAPAFEHHADLPGIDVRGLHGRVLVGQLDGVRSPARADWPLVGADLMVTGATELPVDRDHEHAVVVLDGAVEVQGQPARTDELAYVSRGLGSIALSPSVSPASASPSRVLVLGGLPFPDTILMWWNFVARTRAEVDEAYRDWSDGSDRFGAVHTSLPPMTTPRPPWLG
jgi:redox-sensitive bicupin YhaK (pirin superfamily)